MPSLLASCYVGFSGRPCSFLKENRGAVDVWGRRNRKGGGREEGREGRKSGVRVYLLCERGIRKEKKEEEISKLVGNGEGTVKRVVMVGVWGGEANMFKTHCMES